MEILLVRHTSVDVPKSVCYGQTDVPLTDRFDEEKVAVLAKISALGFATPDAVLYASPLQRCRQLADFLGETQKIAPQLDDQLKEMYFGDWENRLWSDLPEAPVNAWMADFVQTKAPNGENFEDLHARMSQFFQQLLQTGHTKALIVTHAGNIRSSISYALDLPLAHAFRVHLNYGAAVLIDLHEDKNYNKLRCLHS